METKEFYTGEEIVDKYIGPKGTPKRDKLEDSLPRIQLIRIFAPINKNNKGKKECRIYHNGELICRSLPSGSWSRLPNGQKQGA